LVRLGLGLRHDYMVEVRGRKTDRVYSTPVDLLEFKERRFVVAPRGRTQWVRNAEAAGQVALKRGFERRRFRIRIVSNDEKPEILKEYLDRFKLTVQRYFPLKAGSESRGFLKIAERYPFLSCLKSSDRSPEHDKCCKRQCQSSDTGAQYAAPVS
jgi:deazaflavin-dependent oxidoreductase (nitroreductase family)